MAQRVADQAKEQGTTRTSRDRVDEQNQIKHSSGLPLSDTGATKVIITKAIEWGAGYMCDAEVLSGGSAGMSLSNVICDGTINVGNVSNVITTADGVRIQSVATGSSAGGTVTTTVTNIVNNFFTSD